MRMHRTLDKIRRDGLDALKQRLGRAGMIRFLQQLETGDGDYARQRHAWVDETPLSDLKKHATASGRTRRGKS